ncbi:UdgX family uracil-DNA binding protein [Micromonospora sp. NBC_01813]|uniref:UdgX family uracil-DNA binding protein n=1 Tax=Micromonospora sp. NBC_01813 TaxID=2975988 RepID=UPI002DDC4180|nr:UdgX family uracil-DNA binding protein [Micromonospora sp. NBC_01813]WSA11646.1 UdgX family uracil-DNA binding protein [Micromonospora sp. NBC_01813]
MTADETSPGAQRFVPTDARGLADLRAGAVRCQGCELHADASQVVFGRGDATARVVMVGEQPGDVEDRHGLPFVGPAGRLLRRAVDDAAIPVDQIYLTNAVKHFRFQLRGGRRIHQTPDRMHIAACRPWLVAEFAMLRPEVVVVLGATAGQALLGPGFRVTRSRGVPMPWPDSALRPDDFPAGPAHLVATIHPSAVLRADDQETAYRGLVADLGVASRLIRASPRGAVPAGRA